MMRQTEGAFTRYLFRNKTTSRVCNAAACAALGNHVIEVKFS